MLQHQRNHVQCLRGGSRCTDSMLHLRQERTRNQRNTSRRDTLVGWYYKCITFYTLSLAGAGRVTKVFSWNEVGVYYVYFSISRIAFPRVTQSCTSNHNLFHFFCLSFCVCVCFFFSLIGGYTPSLLSSPKTFISSCPHSPPSWWMLIGFSFTFGRWDHPCNHGRQS